MNNFFTKKLLNSTVHGLNEMFMLGIINIYRYKPPSRRYSGPASLLDPKMKAPPWMNTITGKLALGFRLCAVSDPSQSNRNCRHITDTITGKLAWVFSQQSASPVSQIQRLKYLKASGLGLCAVIDHSQSNIDWNISWGVRIQMRSQRPQSVE